MRAVVVQILLASSLAMLVSGCASTNKSGGAEGETAAGDQAANGDQKTGESVSPPGTMDDKGEAATGVGATMTAGDYAPIGKAIHSNREDAVSQEAIKILSRSPYDPVALNALAVTYFKKGKIGAAKLLIPKALEKNPGRAALLNNLAMVNLMEDEPAQAMENLKKALKAEDNPEVAGNLGTLYLMGGDDTRAMSLLESAYKANKSSAPLANNYAVALRHAKNYDAAQKIYDDILRTNPRDVAVLLNDAILLIEYLNKPKDGLVVISKVKFLETDRKDIVDRANTLEKKAKSELK